MFSFYTKHEDLKMNLAALKPTPRHNSRRGQPESEILFLFPHNGPIAELAKTSVLDVHFSPTLFLNC